MISRHGNNSGFLSRMSATSARPDMHSTSLRVRSQILVKSICCVAFTKRILPILMTSFAFQLAFQWILKSKILTPYSSSLVDENTSTYVATFWISECFSSLIVWRIKMQNRNNQSIFYRTNNEFQFFHVDSSLSWYFCALHLTRWKIKNLWRKKFLHFWYISLDST